MYTIKTTVNAAQPGQPFTHNFSSCVGAGRACEGLRADWQQQLRRAVQDCGFRYIRFHGLLTDDMHVVWRNDAGELCYSWQYIDSLFDFLLSIRIRPFVEFGFCPAELASGTQTQFWWQGRVDPPADLRQWADLLAALCRHWLERYGSEEVRKWYFEIWNEADLHAFWNGTRSQYFALYKASVQAIKGVDTALRVGGPATSNFVPDSRFDGETEDITAQKTAFVDDIDALPWHGVWVREFLDYCAQNHLPVDFVSAHPYPTDWALDGYGNTCKRTRKRESLREDVAWLRRVIAESAYPDAELWLTEWSSSPSSRDCSHDELPAACYVADAATSVNGQVNGLSYWTFSDIFEELGGGHDAYHGGFGLVNFNGIPKPTYHVYRMLHRLGNRLLAQGTDFLATAQGDSLRLMAWNYPLEYKKAVEMCAYPDHAAARAVLQHGTAGLLELQLSGLQPHATLTVETLDADHGDAMTLWHAMGCPGNLTVEQTKQLRTCAEACAVTTLQADENGCLHTTLPLASWAVVFVHSTT